jgi:hypothetical protein
MKLNYDAPLTDIKGTAIPDATLGGVLYDVLTAQDNELPGDKKLKLARIAKKVVDKEELLVEEIALVKERVHKYVSTSCILCVEDALEGKE